MIYLFRTSLQILEFDDRTLMFQTVTSEICIIHVEERREKNEERERQDIIAHKNLWNLILSKHSLVLTSWDDC